MHNLDELKLRMERVISEAEDIVNLFEMEIADPRKSVSFQQVKAIETTMESLKSQDLPVPEELKELKLNLFSTYEIHKELLSLYNEFLNSMHSLPSPERLRKFVTNDGEPKTVRPPFRKPQNYKKPLGSKGYNNVENYLIPVIKLMWKGVNHRAAFRQIAQRLDVRYNTVSAQCTRALGLTTDQFIREVNSKTIVVLLERKYPDKYHRIKAELKT